MANADPEVIVTPTDVHRRIVEVRRQGRVVGLAPTMGDLHEGHASLFQRARQETGFVVATIFVNPLQFDSAEDLAKYPATPEKDLRLCADAGVDVVFMPTRETMYPKNSTTIVQVRGLEEPLCGRRRPGHFVGVATVVAKLFHLIPADVAYFGLKDYQQAALIQRMVADLNFPIEIRLCPTVREPDGLAMSSRNSRLSPAERKEAILLSKMIRLAEEKVRGGVRSARELTGELLKLAAAAPIATVDYIEFVDPTTLAPVETLASPTLLALAVRFGATRLIDNVVLVP